MPDKFSPSRLRLARERRGMQLQELAIEVGVTSTSVSLWENGKKLPQYENVAKLSRALRFPEDYFFGDDPPVVPTARFRSLARMTARQRNAALAAGSQCLAIDDWITKHFNRPVPNVPDLRDNTPETAALLTRAAWGLGHRPLPNLVHLMEKHGVRVYSLVHNGSEVDAFSSWQGNTPFVFLNTAKTPERSRMDAAHELGHLVVHNHALAEESKEEEKEAKEFAMAFLLPANAVLASAPKRLTIESILAEKVRWGVSAMAYIRRLHDLKRLSEHVYRGLCIRFRSAGAAYEPDPRLQREHSQVLGKVLSAQSDGRQSVRFSLARALHFPVQDIDDATFGLRITATRGSASEVSTGSATSRVPALKIIR